MADSLKLINRVERIIADYRRGQVVLLKNDRVACAVFSAELVSKNALKIVGDITGSDIFAILTANRAKALSQIDIIDDVKFNIEGVSIDNLIATCIGYDPGNSDILLEAAGDIDKTAILLAKFAERMPSVLVSYINLDNLEDISKNNDLLVISVKEIESYEDSIVKELEAVTTAPLTLKYSNNAKITVFRAGSKEHYALIIGSPEKEEFPLVRIHSACFTGDLLNSLKCDCHDQLHESLEFIGEHGSGIVLYLMQEGRGIGLANKLRAYTLQDSGMDTVDANEFLGFGDDERPYAIAAEMLKKIGINKVRLITNNPRKVKGLEEYGVNVGERVPLIVAPHEHNDSYIETKFSKLGHMGKK